VLAERIVSVADLGEGAGNDCPPLRENFFDFSQQKRTKNEFILSPMDLKKWFLSTTAPPFEKSALPFQNPRSVTEIYMFIQENILIILL